MERERDELKAEVESCHNKLEVQIRTIEHLKKSLEEKVSCLSYKNPISHWISNFFLFVVKNTSKGLTRFNISIDLKRASATVWRKEITNMLWRSIRSLVNKLKSFIFLAVSYWTINIPNVWVNGHRLKYQLLTLFRRWSYNLVLSKLQMVWRRSNELTFWISKQMVTVWNISFLHDFRRWPYNLNCEQSLSFPHKSNLEVLEAKTV